MGFLPLQSQDYYLHKTQASFHTHTLIWPSPLNMDVDEEDDLLFAASIDPWEREG